MTKILNFSSPKKLTIPKIGNSNLGYISVSESQKNIPFEIKRVYWTYYTPQDVLRGAHAHRKLEQVIFAVSGIITIDVEDLNGTKYTFILDEPNNGLYLPPFTWRDIKFSHNAVLLCLASDFYEESDYIREYDEYKRSLKQ